MSRFLILNKIASGYREEGDPVRTQLVAVNPAAIRSFNPRRENAPGTRLTFTDGGGYAVTETFEEVLAFIGERLTTTVADQAARLAEYGIRRGVTLVASNDAPAEQPN
jgi:hypothetical protein